MQGTLKARGRMSDQAECGRNIAGGRAGVPCSRG